MSVAYVKRYYGVPLKRGMAVTAGGRRGRVTSAPNQYVRVLLEGAKHPVPFHPLDLDYGDGIDHGARHEARLERFCAAVNRKPA